MLPHLELKKTTLALQTGERKLPKKLTTDWSQFRGPERDGSLPSGNRIKLVGFPLLRWKVPSGEGHSSIITSANRSLPWSKTAGRARHRTLIG